MELPKQRLHTRAVSLQKVLRKVVCVVPLTGQSLDGLPEPRVSHRRDVHCRLAHRRSGSVPESPSLPIVRRGVPSPLSLQRSEVRGKAGTHFVVGFRPLVWRDKANTNTAVKSSSDTCKGLYSRSRATSYAASHVVPQPMNTYTYTACSTSVSSSHVPGTSRGSCEATAGQVQYYPAAFILNHLLAII